jgi:hypothetical protein
MTAETTETAFDRITGLTDKGDSRIYTQISAEIPMKNHVSSFRLYSANHIIS